ncbi:restriction endonuclease [Pirellulaceae bacterium]|nr:restriction endonuclease [Pirellulaceae bacterium]
MIETRYVRDNDQRIYGPISNEAFELWLKGGLIKETFFISNDRVNWTSAKELVLESNNEYSYTERLRDLISLTNHAIKWVASKYISSLKVDIEDSAIGLRSCFCKHHQCSVPARCSRCGSETVGMDPVSVISGKDQSDIALHEYKELALKKFRRVLIGAHSFVLLVFSIIIFAGDFNIFPLGVLVSMLLPLSIPIIYAQQIKRRIKEIKTTIKSSVSRGLINHAISEYWIPFLEKHEGQNFYEKAVRVVRNKTPYATSETAISTGQLELMLTMLEGKGIQLFDGTVPLKSIVQSIANLLDYNLFVSQLEDIANTCPSFLHAYTLLIPEIRCATYLPYLQAAITSGRVPEHLGQLPERIEMIRAAQELENFEADLTSKGRFNLTIQKVDMMNPFAFERLIGLMYEAEGYEYIETPASGDQGADVIVRKAGQTLVIQAKLYSSSIGNKAVQEVIAARTHFNCNHAAVLTNQTYTKSAIELAESGNVTLYGRQELTEMIRAFNDKPKDYGKLKQLFDWPARQSPEPIDHIVEDWI